MTETELLFGLKKHFPDKDNFRQIVSRFIHHPSVWAGLQDNDFFCFCVKKLSDCIDKWCLAEICRASNEFNNSNSNIEKIELNDTDKTGDDWLSELINNTSPHLPLSDFYPVSTIINSYIDQKSWQELIRKVPELKREVVSTVWGTIFSLVQEESKDKGSFFEPFFSTNHNRDGILEIAAFILGANPEIFSLFEKYVEKDPTKLDIDRLIKLLPKIQFHGGQDVTVKIANLIYKNYPLEKFVQSPSKEQSARRIIEHLIFLEKYGTLTRYLPSEINTAIFLEKVDNSIEKLRSLIIDPFLPNFNEGISFKSSSDKNVPGTANWFEKETTFSEKLHSVKEIAQQDPEAGFLMAKNIAEEINSSNNQLIWALESKKIFEALVNFLCDFGLIHEANTFINRKVKENPYDPILLRIAARFFHDYGGHIDAIQYYARLDSLSNLSREEKIQFSISLEYCGQWEHAYRIREGVNVLNLDDLVDFYKCAYAANQPEIMDDGRNTNTKEFNESDFHQTLVAWKDIIEGNQAKGEASFDELLRKKISDPDTIIILADYLFNHNQREKAIDVLSEFCQRVPTASVLLKKILIQIGFQHIAEMTKDLDKLIKLVPQMDQKEFETYSEILIELNAFDLAMAAIEQKLDNWPLSHQLSGYKARIFLEKGAYHQAEIILKKLIQSNPKTIKNIVDLSLAILNCSRTNFPFGLSTQRIPEVKQLLSAISKIDSDDFYFHLLKAEVSDDAINDYRKFLSGGLSLNKNKLWHLYSAIGRQFFQKSKYDLAIVHYMDALAIRPDHPDTILSITESFEKLQLWDEAINLVDNYIKKETLPFIFFWRLHQQLHISDAWHQYISRNYMENPENSTIGFLYSAALISKGNLEDGLRLMDESSIISNSDVTRMLIFAQILADAGETTRSKRMIELILSNNDHLKMEEYLSCAFLLDQLGETEKEMNLLDQIPFKNHLSLTYSAYLKSDNGYFVDSLKTINEILHSKEDQFENSSQDLILVKKPGIWDSILMNPTTMYLIGCDAAMHFGDSETALQLIETGLGHFKENLVLLKKALELSMLIENREEMAKWGNLLTSRLDEVPDSIGFCILGELSLFNGEEVQAARYLSRAIECNQWEDERIQAMQARMLLRNGNRHEARKIFENIKFKMLAQNSNQSKNFEKNRKFDCECDFWYLQAADELEESRICLDLCQQQIETTRKTFRFQRIFLKSLTRLLVRNEVFKEFHVKNHLNQIGDHDLKLFEEIKGKINFNEWPEMILVCDAIISGQLADYKKILEIDLDQEFASIKIKAEFLINDLDTAEIQVNSLKNDQLATLQLAGLIINMHPQKSIVLLNQLMADYPDDPLILAALGIALRKTGQLEDAYAAINLALRFWPEEYEWEILSGEICLEVGDIKSALEHYENSKRINPSESVKNYIQEILLKNRNPRAISLLEERIGNNPFDVNNLLELANLYIENKQFSKAVMALKRVLQNDNQNTVALVLLANIAIKLENYDKAEKFLTNILKNNPNCIEALLPKVDVIRNRQGYQKAIEFLDEILDKKPEKIGLVIDKKSSLIESEFGQRAALEYLKSLENIKNDQRLMLRASRLFLEINELEAAENISYQALNLQTSAEAYAMLADISSRKGNFDRAVDAYIKAIKAAPLTKKYYIKLAEIYDLQRNIHLAKETLRNALKTIPDDLDLLIKYAQISYKNNQIEEGVNYLKRALQINPYHLEANDLLDKYQMGMDVKEMVSEKM